MDRSAHPVSPPGGGPVNFTLYTAPDTGAALAGMGALASLDERADSKTTSTARKPARPSMEGGGRAAAATQRPCGPVGAPEPAVPQGTRVPARRRIPQGEVERLAREAMARSPRMDGSLPGGGAR
jgi:hypothetical protein